ncbi:hypothetical protein [Verminephrobacter aporrectodeae]|uniref:hypothetical protein n=1 Tax=Verminephrobacter aporrectodeae TaxID=1110389 RepID=UPI002243BCFC|nr:hypothetical protein [Verminephrobacter aporrectodeae]
MELASALTRIVGERNVQTIGALQAVTALPDVQAKLKELSATPVGSTPETLTTLVATETAKWRAVIQSIGGLKRD